MSLTGTSEPWHSPARDTRALIFMTGQQFPNHPQHLTSFDLKGFCSLCFCFSEIAHGSMALFKISCCLTSEKRQVWFRKHCSLLKFYFIVGTLNTRATLLGSLLSVRNGLAPCAGCQTAHPRSCSSHPESSGFLASTSCFPSCPLQATVSLRLKTGSIHLKGSYRGGKGECEGRGRIAFICFLVLRMHATAKSGSGQSRSQKLPPGLP